MSWDISFTQAETPPPPVAEMPDDWRGVAWGPAADLRAALSAQFPAIDWSDPLWGIYDGAGFSMEFDLGSDDPVEGFVVHMRGGGEAAITAVERLLALPGWYGLDCAAEEWVHHGADLRASWERFQSARDTVTQKPEAGGSPRSGLLSFLRSLFGR